jgi:hypothetical protein
MKAFLFFYVKIDSYKMLKILVFLIYIFYLFNFN